MTKSGIYLKLKAIIWKHYIVRKRRWILSLLEILIPAYIAINIIITQQLDLKQQFINITRYYPPYTEKELYDRYVDRKIKVYYAPTTLFTEEIMNDVVSLLKINDLKNFSTESELNTYFKRYGANEEHIMGIVFENVEKIPHKCNYVLRPYRQDFLWETDELFDVNKKIVKKSGSQKYIEKSILAIKMAIDLTYLNMMTIDKNISFDITLQRFPYPPYTYKKSTHRMQKILPHTIMFGYAFLCPIILHKIVRDQRTGVKELMKMVGVKPWMLWLGWFINFFILNLIVIAIIIIFLVVPLSANVHAPFEYSDAGILMLFHILYGASAIIFTFALSTFCTKPLLIMIIGTFTWITSFYIPVGIIKYNPYLRWTNRLFLLLIPNACLIFGYEEIIYYEEKDIGMHWDRIGKHVDETRNVTLSTVFIMLAVDCILYFLITLYIENIKPGRYGTAKSIMYPCQSFYNCISKYFDDNEEDDNENQTHNDVFCKIMEEQPNLPVKIKIKNLIKQYEHVTAINKLSMNVVEKQITVLTGHNGAGKTTILNVITGITSASSGAIFINGKNIQSSRKELTDCIGFCPQNDLLFSNITIVEHFIIFGMLKGLTKVEAEFEANELIFRLGIHLQSFNLGSHLYGGTKRKVALGMAFIANPEILLLDEPTVGLDPESRQSIWDLLLSFKGIKTLLITTHSMEEAEILGDQIAILDHGNLVCFGSLNYLKQEFAVGYSLLLDYFVQAPPKATTFEIHSNEVSKINQKKEANKTEKNQPSQVQQIMNLILNIIPYAILQSDKKNRLIILLPHDSKPLFGKLFETLEKSKDDFGLTKIDLATTNILEDVFSKFERTLADEVTEEEFLNKEKEIVQKCVVPSSKIPNGKRKTCLQIRSLLQKRIYQTKRCWKLYLFELLLTLLTTLLTVHLENNWSNMSNEALNTFYFDLSAYSSSNVYYSAPETNASFASQIAMKYSNIVSQQYTKVIKVSSVSKAILNEGVNNLKLLVVAAEFNVTGDGNYKRALINAMYSNNASHGAPISLNLVMNSILQIVAGEDYSIVSAIKPLPNVRTVFKETGTLTNITFWATLFPLGLLFFSSIFLMIPMYEKSLNYKHLQIMSGVRPIIYWGTHFIWDCFLFFVMMSLALLIICFYGMVYEIPYNTYHAIGALTSILIVYGLSIIPYTYLFSYTRVASEGFLTFMIINLVITMILMYHFVFYDVNHQYQKVADVFKHILFLYPQFGLTYASLEFSRQANWNFNWQITSIEERFSICRLEYNPCCDGYNISSCENYQSYFTGNHEIQNIIIIMFSSTFLYIILICILESQITRKCWDNMINKYDKYNLSMIDRIRRYDVIWEQRRVETTYKVEKSSTRAIMHSYEIYQNADLLLAWNLQKHYKHTRIVSGISFGIKPGDCFGLVGVNGVGKTTIFRILTGDLPLVRGDTRIYYNNNLAYLSKNRKTYLEKIGYCPQINSVLHMLTGREMLRLSAQLYGVRANLEDEVMKWLTALGLQEYADVISKNYSDGSRRKLCLAMALIGNPLLILLDEPTNNVDPGSRRKLWSIVNLLLHKESNPSSLIMTSHLMDECETMCNKIAIMKKGRLDCFGLIPKIKQKYGDGFIITLYLKPHSNIQTNSIVEIEPVVTKNLITEFEKMFKGICTLQEKHPFMLKYRIVDETKPWSELFSKIEKLKTFHWIIQDYVINRTSLEETFLSVARS